MCNPLARFSFESNKLNKKECKPELKLFEPPKNMRLSVARIKGLSCDKIKEVGIAFGRKRTDNVKRFYGWARLTKEALSEIGLDLDDSTKETCLHSEITGWEKDNTAKRDRQVQKLVEISQAIILNSPIPLNS